MLIAIISDSHDNIPNIEKFLKWAEKNKTEMIIHCGDIATGESIEKLSEFLGQIHLVFGNMDQKRDEVIKAIDKYDNIKLHGDQGELKVDNQKIVFCHFPDQAKQLAQSGKYNLVFYGHTHKPWIEKIGRCEMINPGTLGGVFYKASFAVYNTENKRLELKVLENINHS